MVSRCIVRLGYGCKYGWHASKSISVACQLRQICTHVRQMTMIHNYHILFAVRPIASAWWDTIHQNMCKVTVSCIHMHHMDICGGFLQCIIILLPYGWNFFGPSKNINC
jgi:hypothetical protein